jgi:hypothetical protein
MSLRTRTLACGLIVLGLLLLGTGSALAGGGGGSAGNSQYVDPLSAKPSGHHKTQTTTTTAGTPSTTGTSTGSSTLSQSAPSSVASSGSSGKKLPFTGLDLWACIGLGLGLLGVGLALRRTLTRMY